MFPIPQLLSQVSNPALPPSIRDNIFNAFLSGIPGTGGQSIPGLLSAAQQPGAIPGAQQPQGALSGQSLNSQVFSPILGGQASGSTSAATSAPMSSSSAPSSYQMNGQQWQSIIQMLLQKLGVSGGASAAGFGSIGSPGIYGG